MEWLLDAHPLTIEFWLLRKRISELRQRKEDDSEILMLCERQHRVWLLNMRRNAKLIRKANEEFCKKFPDKCN